MTAGGIFVRFVDDAEQAVDANGKLPRSKRRQGSRQQQGMSFSAREASQPRCTFPPGNAQHGITHRHVRIRLCKIDLLDFVAPVEAMLLWEGRATLQVVLVPLMPLHECDVHSAGFRPGIFLQDVESAVHVCRSFGDCEADLRFVPLEAIEEEISIDTLVTTTSQVSADMLRHIVRPQAFQLLTGAVPITM